MGGDRWKQSQLTLGYLCMKQESEGSHETLKLSLLPGPFSPDTKGDSLLSGLLPPSSCLHLLPPLILGLRLHER